jgi:hypothetical protein
MLSIWHIDRFCCQVIAQVTKEQILNSDKSQTSEGMPCIVLGKLRPAAAPGALEGVQLMAAPAALAEALHEAGALKGGRLDVHIANATLLVVCAEHAQISIAALHLAAGATPQGCLLAS